MLYWNWHSGFVNSHICGFFSFSMFVIWPNQNSVVRCELCVDCWFKSARDHLPKSKTSYYIFSILDYDFTRVAYSPWSIGRTNRLGRTLKNCLWENRIIHKYPFRDALYAPVLNIDFAFSQSDFVHKSHRAPTQYSFAFRKWKWKWMQKLNLQFLFIHSRQCVVSGGAQAHCIAHTAAAVRYDWLYW